MLSIEDILLLKTHHFTELEIEKLNTDLASKPQPLDLNHDPWKTTLEKRKEWAERKTREVASRNNIPVSEAYSLVLQYIDKAYQKISSLSVWVFLRSSYEKSRGYKTDYMKALKARTKALEMTRQVYKT